MARLAPKILHGGHFVDRDADLGSIRRRESERALSQLGIKAYHLGLPDGQLQDTEHRTKLTDRIMDTVRHENIKAIATLGLNGYCGHDDHVAAHYAAIDAQIRLAFDDVHVPILALNHNHRGQLRIPVPTQQKLAALAVHESQFGDVAERQESFEAYQMLFYLETYDLF